MGLTQKGKGKLTYEAISEDVFLADLRQSYTRPQMLATTHLPMLNDDLKFLLSRLLRDKPLLLSSPAYALQRFRELTKAEMEQLHMYMTELSKKGDVSSKTGRGKDV